MSVRHNSLFHNVYKTRRGAKMTQIAYEFGTQTSRGDTYKIKRACRKDRPVYHIFSANDIARLAHLAAGVLCGSPRVSKGLTLYWDVKLLLMRMLLHFG